VSERTKSISVLVLIIKELPKRIAVKLSTLTVTNTLHLKDELAKIN